MSKFATATFLVLYGILGLVETKLPNSVLPLVALVAGATVLMEPVKKQ